jgi:hypothetical protein
MIIVSVKAPAPPAKCTCTVVDYSVHYGGLAKTPDLLLDVWEFRGFIPQHVYITVLYYELLYKPADAFRDALWCESLVKVADVAVDKPLVEVEAKTATTSNDILTIEREVTVG